MDLNSISVEDEKNELTDGIDTSDEDENEPSCYTEGDREHCDCKDGFFYDGMKCVPISPGELMQAPLGCDEGFELNEQNICEDIDECLEETSDCHFYEDCINTRGSFECKAKTCAGGLTLNMNTGDCDDINECLSSPCGPTQKCVNHHGSYECRCMTGYRAERADPKMCRDIDECLEHPGICDQGCYNYHGSYRCTCHRGYTLGHDNRTCVDVDECRSKSRSVCPGKCRNTRGSYACSCPAGLKPERNSLCLGRLNCVLICDAILAFLIYRY